MRVKTKATVVAAPGTLSLMHRTGKRGGGGGALDGGDSLQGGRTTRLPNMELMSMMNQNHPNMNMNHQHMVVRPEDMMRMRANANANANANHVVG